MNKNMFRKVRTILITVACFILALQIGAPVKAEAAWIRVGSKWRNTNQTQAGYSIGWDFIDQKWYYFDKNGYMQIGWIKLGNEWYYLENSGAMLTGWQQINSVWYYLNESGAMQTGWLNLGGTWYYLDESGAMRTGWIQLGEKWYFCYESGSMAANTWTPDGNYVGQDGAWIQGAHADIGIDKLIQDVEASLRNAGMITIDEYAKTVWTKEVYDQSFAEGGPSHGAMYQKYTFSGEVGQVATIINAYKTLNAKYYYIKAEGSTIYCYYAKGL